MDFVPLSVRRGIRSPIEHVPGVPAHVRGPLISWVRGFFIEPTWGDVVEKLLDQVIAALQWPIANESASVRFDDLISRIKADDDDFLDLIDLLCRISSAEARRELETYLDIGKSTWRVSANEPHHLEERLTGAAHDMVETAVGPEDRAAQEIAVAWSKAFGRDLDAKGAWHAAVSAIEFMLAPVALPKANAPTLGTMTSALRAKPEKWAFTVAADDEDRTARPFLRALELVGYEPGRHGTDPERASIEQARTVVLQAVTIVEWLRMGALRVVDIE